MATCSPCCVVSLIYIWCKAQSPRHLVGTWRYSRRRSRVIVEWTWRGVPKQRIRSQERLFLSAVLQRQESHRLLCASFSSYLLPTLSSAPSPRIISRHVIARPAPRRVRVDPRMNLILQALLRALIACLKLFSLIFRSLRSASAALESILFHTIAPHAALCWSLRDPLLWGPSAFIHTAGTYSCG